MVDEQDGKTYYAQIRGFIQDQYCEKSAALTWLIPTQASPKDCFDPASYIIGNLQVFVLYNYLHVPRLMQSCVFLINLFACQVHLFIFCI